MCVRLCMNTVSVQMNTQFHICWYQLILKTTDLHMALNAGLGKVVWKTGSYPYSKSPLHDINVV